MPTDDARPYVDDQTRGSLTEYLAAVLERATPDSYVGGGASEDYGFTRRPRNHETLSERQEIYASGGPITEFIDTRAMMTYGTGVEFTTDRDALTDDQDRTVAEWLSDHFPQLDEHFIQRGIQTYWAGDAWGEIVETQGGDFSHVELIDPTTVHAEWDQHGEITGLTQIVDSGQGNLIQQELDPDRVAHFWFKRSTGGPLGESLIAQNRETIQRYAHNQEQRKNAIRLHGSPHYHVAVGSDGQSISDRLIRRVRDQFSSRNTDEKTNWVTGGDIEISELDAPGFEGMESITQTDVAMLASGFGIPLEWTNFGSDGLGSGTPAQSRQTKFERQARAEQRRAAQQFVEQVVRPVLQNYSPFPRDIDVGLEFGDVVSDQQAAAEWMRDFKSYMTPDEIRTALNLGPAPDDADLGPPEGTPDDPEAGAPTDGGGGLFADADDGPTATPAIGDGGGPGNATRALFHDGNSADALTQEELVWADVYETVLWAEETDRQLFEFDPEEVPQFVIDRLNTAVAEGALFDSFETIPDWAAADIEDVMLDSLETRHGWSVDSIAQNLQDMALGLDRADAERIARTETAALVNDAREQGYEQQFDTDEERFKWVGPSGDRTTEACEWLKEQTNPDFGGDPVSLGELKDLVAEAQDRFFPDLQTRDWIIHINERHTYTRHIE